MVAAYACHQRNNVSTISRALLRAWALIVHSLLRVLLTRLILRMCRLCRRSYSLGNHRTPMLLGNGLIKFVLSMLTVQLKRASTVPRRLSASIACHHLLGRVAEDPIGSLTRAIMKSWLRSVVLASLWFQVPVSVPAISRMTLQRRQPLYNALGCQNFSLRNLLDLSTRPEIWHFTTRTAQCN